MTNKVREASLSEVGAPDLFAGLALTGEQKGQKKDKW